MSKLDTLWRGLRGFCPSCGEGRLLSGYLKQRETCSGCGERIGDYRADDGPAWLTILLTGHIVAPFIGFFALNDLMPGWVSMLAILTAATSLVLLLLPRSKGLFIAILWLTRAREAEAIEEG